MNYKVVWVQYPTEVIELDVVECSTKFQIVLSTFRFPLLVCSEIIFRLLCNISVLHHEDDKMKSWLE